MCPQPIIMLQCPLAKPWSSTTVNFVTPKQPQALIPKFPLKSHFSSARLLFFFLLCDLRCDHHNIFIHSYRYTIINWPKRKVKGSPPRVSQRVSQHINSAFLVHFWSRLSEVIWVQNDSSHQLTGALNSFPSPQKPPQTYRKRYSRLRLMWRKRLEVSISY